MLSEHKWRKEKIKILIIIQQPVVSYLVLLLLIRSYLEDALGVVDFDFA
jgi:hypothetical protein